MPHPAFTPLLPLHPSPSPLSLSVLRPSLSPLRPGVSAASLAAKRPRGGVVGGGLLAPAMMCVEAEGVSTPAAAEGASAKKTLSRSERMAALLGKDLDTEAARQKQEAEKREAQVKAQKKKERWLAAAGVFVGAFLAVAEALNPEAPVALLKKSEIESAPMSSIANGKPTLIDIHAEWCSNCKQMAPGLYNLEHSPGFAGRVNFISLDADDPKNADIIDRLEVDGIPHHVIIDKDGELKATLVGLVPIEVFRADLRALLSGKSTVPYEGVAYKDVKPFSK